MKVQSPALGTVDRSRDVAACLLLFAGALAYLSRWPHDLFGPDEGLFLYDAKRLLQGDVFYRDIFEIITPGAFYVMAALYAVFGISVDTARTSMAVVHGCLVILVYGMARLAGVRRSLAAAAGVTHLALCYPPLAIASAHWFGTLLILSILGLLLRRPPLSSRRCAVLGVLTAALALVQQQKAPSIAAGVVAVLVLDGLWERRAAPRAASLRRQLLAYIGAVLAVALPVAVWLIGVAGPQQVFHALVEFPLNGYRRYPMHQQTSWGYYLTAVSQLYVWPRLMKYLPAAIPLALARGLWRWRKADASDHDRVVLVLGVYAAFCVQSVLYQPNYTHLAIIGPVWLVVVAEAAEAIAKKLERIGFIGTAVTVALSLGLFVALADRLQRNVDTRRQRNPASHETDFGRVDFHDPAEVVVVDYLREQLRELPSREIFVFPGHATLYLTANATNPTRFQLLIDRYSDPEHFDEVVATLEKRKVAFVVRAFWIGPTKQNRLRSYLSTKYEWVLGDRDGRSFGSFIVYRRKDAPAAAP